MNKYTLWFGAATCGFLAFFFKDTGYGVTACSAAAYVLLWMGMAVKEDK